MIALYRCFRAYVWLVDCVIEGINIFSHLVHFDTMKPGIHFMFFCSLMIEKYDTVRFFNLDVNESRCSQDDEAWPNLLYISTNFVK